MTKDKLEEEIEGDMKHFGICPECGLHIADIPKAKLSQRKTDIEMFEKIQEEIIIEKDLCEKDRLILRKTGSDGRKQAELGGMEYAYSIIIKKIEELKSKLKELK